MAKRSKWGLIGIPDHQGVVHVGGRIGAALGPSAFRRVLARMKGAALAEPWTDFGDVAGLGADIHANHRAAISAIAEAHASCERSVVVGGGHDHGYTQLAGVAEALELTSQKKLRLACINIDAHLDVRAAEPVPTSGSPFYLAIENGVIDPRRLVEFGIQTHANAPELFDYVKKKKVKSVGFDAVREKAPARFEAALRSLAASSDAIVISLDLDAAAEAFAPGVSAPQAEGFSSNDLIGMMEIAGAHPKVVSLGIFELAPPHDIGDRTARLAATACYYFVEASLRSRIRRA